MRGTRTSLTIEFLRLRSLSASCQTQRLLRKNFGFNTNASELCANKRLAVSPCNRRMAFRFKSSSTNEAASSAAKTGDEGMSMGKKVGLFSAFLAVGGGGTFAWMLATDEDFLFKMRDLSPGLVNFFAPLVGLPVEEESGELDVEAFAPRSIGEIVGEKVKVAVVLRSGRVVLVDADAETSVSGLEQAVCEKLGDPNTITQDPVVSFDFVNAEEEAHMAQQSEQELEKHFGIQIPEIPPNPTRQQLMVALTQCRFLEADLTVNKELAKKYQTDETQIERALVQIEQRKREIKAVIKKTRR
mmetsp:Transcript_14575/g.16945  ORF Transcript_14575/g.16945 Transcript_14575/m.16945 type:complete len:300 (+) Transcript_14575:165-1064(+)